MSDRRARLAALAAKAGRIQGAVLENEEQQPPENEIQQQESMSKKDADGSEPASKRSRLGELLSEDNDDENALERALIQAQNDASVVNIASGTEAILAAAPKKANWDLKRDIQQKVDKLERRTQKAIVELLKQRLEQQAEID